jgi:hypothetical protein
MADQPETEKTDAPRRVGKKTPIALWVALIVVMVLGVLWERVRLPNAKDRFGRIPLKGLGFAGQELPLDEVELKVFGKADVLNRVYAAGPYKFVLTIIDGTNDRHAVHDPLYCFKGAGWSVDGQIPKRIAGGEGKILKLSKEGRQVEAMIWFSDGRERHASALLYWWQTTVRRITIGKSGDEPILIVIQPAGQAALNWDVIFDAFPSLRTI